MGIDGDNFMEIVNKFLNIKVLGIDKGVTLNRKQCS